MTELINTIMKHAKSNTPANEKDLSQTPWWFIRAFEVFMCKKIKLDVCAQANNAKCDRYFSIADGKDSLTSKWDAGDGFAWCNPPFSNVMPFIKKAVEEARANGVTTAMIIPNNPEVSYRRELKRVSDTFVEMPFRLKFQRCGGEKFLDKNGKETSPQFSCAIGIITPHGVDLEPRSIELDLRDSKYNKEIDE